MRPRALALASLLLVAPAAAAGEFFTLEGHGGPIKAIDVSPDGGRILTASFDYSLGLWTGGAAVWLEAHRAAVNAVRFVDATRAVSAGDDFDLYLWDLASRRGQRLGGHRGKIVGLALAPDRGSVATASWDGRIGLWPLDGGPPRFLEGHRAGVNAVVFSADGARLYSASADGTIRVWNLAARSPTRRLLSAGFGVNALVLNEVAGWLAYGALDGAIRVVDMETGAVVADLTRYRSPILSMAADPGFTTLAVGDGDGFIRTIDCRDLSIARQFRATLHGPVWALRFSPDGRNIHAGGLDTAMYSWPVAEIGKLGRMATGEISYLKDPARMDNGERQFQRKCSICHTLGPDGLRRAGPTLYRIFGRAAGTLPGYRYSRTLRDAGFVWDGRTIDALFAEGPDNFIPGSKMPMQRIAASADRDDLITFLKRATIDRKESR